MRNDIAGIINNTKIYTLQGDITEISADAILTTLNPDGIWLGGVDRAIIRRAGDFYHFQARNALPFFDLQTIVAYGDRKYHKGSFDNVIFISDALKSPLELIVFKGLEAANNESYKDILLPLMRTGIFKGKIEKTINEAIDRLSMGIRKYLGSYSSTNFESIKFVTYNNNSLDQMLRSTLHKTLYG